MILKPLSLFFIILLLLIQTQAQRPNCISPTSNKLLSSSYDAIPNFKSGTCIIDIGAATLINKQAARYNYYNITLGLNFNQSYEMAISIQNIDSFLPTNQLDFYVNGLKKPTVLNVVFGIDSSIRWTSVQIYFIVSARNDFLVGIFVANNAAFLETSKKGNLAKITYNLPNKINASSDFLYAMPFISGLRTYDLSLNFTFSSTSYNSTKNLLSISLQISFMKFPLESLYISYLIFNMASDLEITSFGSLSFAPSNVNVFMGVSGISPFTPPTNKTKTTFIALAAPTQNQQTFDMIFGINGIIIQTQQSMDLLFRSSSPTNATNFQVLECVSKSKCNGLFGTIIYDQIDIFTVKSKCIICMNHAFYNQTLGNCQCLRGYIQRNNLCLKISQTCGENASFDNQTSACKCNPLFANISNKCVSIYQICPQGSIFFQGKCIKIVYSSAAVANCSPDTLFINKTCVPKANCSEPLLLNTNTNVCQCPINMQLVNSTCRPCSSNQTYNNKICQCKLGYFRIAGNCLQCSPYGFFNGTTCVCFRYYEGDGFKCSKKNLDGNELAKSRAPLGAKGSGAINLN